MIALLSVFFLLEARGQTTEDLAELKILEQLESRFREPPRFGRGPTVLPSRGGLPEPRVTPQEIVASPLAQKALRYPAQLEDLRTGDFQIVNRPLLLRVHVQTDSEGHFYVRNAQNELSHRVDGVFIEDLAPITSMAEEPLRYTPVTERKNISPYDADFGQRGELALSYGLANANWTADVLRDVDARAGNGYQLGTRWLAEFQERFLLGVSAVIEERSSGTQTLELRQRSFGFGAVAKSPQFEHGGFPWRLFVESRVSPFGALELRAPGLATDLALRTLSLSVGWERNFRNPLGPWSWGIVWQRDWPRLRSRDDLVAQKTSVQSNDFFMLQLAQGVEW